MGWILFFDGDCAFCSAGVRRVFRADRRGSLRFAPLQGILSREKGFSEYADPARGSMVILREEDGAFFVRGDAVLELGRALGGPWRLLLAGRILPRCLRDALYSLVAKNRYWISRKGDFCELPEPEFLARILE